MPTLTRRETTTAKTPGRWYARGGVLALADVAAVGAVLSWGSLYQAATRHLGQHSPVLTIQTRMTHGHVNLVAAAFPLLLDLTILGATLRYVAGVKAGHPVAGYRVTAHCAIALTIAMNAASADTLGDTPWHMVAPAMWSVIVELYGRDVLGQLREVRQTQRPDAIPLRLWITVPVESARAAWRMARTGEPSATAARAQTEQCAAARDRLHGVTAGWKQSRTRRQILRRLWSGALNPNDLMTMITEHETQPHLILPAVLDRVVTPAHGQQPAETSEQSARPSSPRRQEPSRTIPVPEQDGTFQDENQDEDEAPGRPQARPEDERDDRNRPQNRTTGRDENHPQDEGRTVDHAGEWDENQDGLQDGTNGQDENPADTEPRMRTRRPSLATELQTIISAVGRNEITGRVTNSKISDYLRCSNTRASEINRLYKNEIKRAMNGTERPEVRDQLVGS